MVDRIKADQRRPNKLIRTLLHILHSSTVCHLPVMLML